MKKIFTVLLAALMTVTCMTVCIPAAAQGADSDEGFLFSFNYAEKVNGIVDKKNTAELEKTELDGKKVLKVIPDSVNALDTKLRLDCYSLAIPAKDIESARFMTIEYKYDAPEQYKLAEKMKVSLYSNGNALKSSFSVNSMESIKSGEWTTAVFDVSKIGEVIDTTAGNIFKQFHFFPYGEGANPANMSDEQVMYIGDVSFWSLNPDKNTEYTVTFRKGHPEASGEDPDTLILKRGQKYTLPEHGYQIEKAEFLGWKYSEDNQLYMPGTEFTAIDNNVNFTAEFDSKAATAEYKALLFADYHGGSVDKKDNLIVTTEMFQEKNVVKAVPNPTGIDAAKIMAVDGYRYNTAEIDLGIYKHFAVTYYLDGELPKNANFSAVILPNGGALTKSFVAQSAQNLNSGRWDFATFDLSGIEENLTPGLTSHILKHIQLRVFNGLNATDLTGNEALYIHNIMFFKDKPDLEAHESYMKGYEGGIFNPGGNMTRAEAATIIARLAAGNDELVPTDKTTAFTDVPADQWYYKYISYVESLGYLRSYSGVFEPNKAITRAEFVELVYNMELLSDNGKNGTFTDVAADHPRAAVISAAGKAGLVNGYDNGNGTFSFKPDNTITRAEVVTVINNACGRSITAGEISDDVKYFFTDVSKDFWAYPDIVEATLPHVEDSNGWVFAMVSPLTLFAMDNSTLDYAAGEAKVKETDALAEQRKTEILATPTSVEVTGTKYYVSNNGNDNNDGKSPETAWKTIAKVNSYKPHLNPGDGIFFERGGLWRERLTGVTGITYSAYGEGEKPKIYGSPENGADASMWTLMEGTANIWVYKNELLDVGGIICDAGKVVGLKEVPDLIGDKYFVRGTRQTEEFDIITELSENYEFFSDVRAASALATTKGKLYFRCDEGNPGELFEQIEFNIKGNAISNGNATDTHYDNLCIMYTGTHGIGSGTTKNLTVTNCEIGWIGGTIHSYSEGVASRLGNGVEIFGGCDGYLVDNNYIYQCYDAGATHQKRFGNEDISMYNIKYSNNLIEDCIYSIEYFNGESDDGKAIRDGKNFVICDNIMRRAGYGWGNQRPDAHVSAHIKGWSMRNEYDKGTYIIENNIFDRASWKMFQTVATYEAWCPVYRNNTYIQVVDGGLAEYKSMNISYDCYAPMTIKADLGDDGADVYFLPESYKHQGFLIRG